MTNTCTSLQDLFDGISSIIKFDTETDNMQIVADNLPAIIRSSVFRRDYMLMRRLTRDIVSVGAYTLRNITSIKHRAFCDCKKLVNIALPEGLTSIGNQAFSNCPSLALTSLPEGLTNIGNEAFRDCTSLALTSLPANLTSIGNFAFQNCTNLKSLTFKGTPTSIHSSIFSQCTNLTTINVPWSEGEVAGAPWGATNATINYNYTGG